MQYVTDLHLHSKYSRAVSQQMILPEMARIAKEKGLDILTVSDWTHPLWMKEISELLKEEGEGIYKLKNFKSDTEKETLFIFTTEISSIYKQNGKLRRIHNLIFAPSIESAKNISNELIKKGANLTSDGRPIIGLSSKQLLELILSVDKNSILIPSHVWTPHFGIYGSASGYDSVVESFEDLAPLIYGIETGLSSDPEMNWELQELNKRSILSFSDAHSLAKMGREATILELEKPNYPNIIKAFKNERNNSIVYTIEFYPEEGKYHYTGHRDCKVSFNPQDVEKKGILCPVCHKKMTEGVLNRVKFLSGVNYNPKAVIKKNKQGLRWFTDPTNNHPPFVKLVPLLEIIAQATSSTTSSLKVKEIYFSLVKSIGSEIDILLKKDTSEIATRFGEKIAEGIDKVRKGEITIIPGFDNQYGIVKIWQNGEKSQMKSSQMSLL